jgi:hypothetical protein
LCWRPFTPRALIQAMVDCIGLGRARRREPKLGEKVPNLGMTVAELCSIVRKTTARQAVATKFDSLGQVGEA